MDPGARSLFGTRRPSELDQFQKNTVGVTKQCETSCADDINFLRWRFENDSFSFETGDEFREIFRAKGDSRHASRVGRGPLLGLDSGLDPLDQFDLGPATVMVAECHDSTAAMAALERHAFHDIRVRAVSEDMHDPETDQFVERDGTPDVRHVQIEMDDVPYQGCFPRFQPRMYQPPLTLMTSPVTKADCSDTRK